MFKNRFLLVLGVLSLLLATMAVSKPYSKTPTAAELSWPPRPVIIPAMGATDLSDYYQRHYATGVAIPVTGSWASGSDYFERHFDLFDLNIVTGTGITVDLADYFVRHTELRTSSKSADLSWPPRPVIIPVTGVNTLSDYYQRHSEQSTAAIANTTNEDFFQRHSGQEAGSLADVGIPVTGSAAALSDYFQRHSGLSAFAKSADLSWPPRPIIIPVTGANTLSDYYQRHSEQSAGAIANTSNDDYFQRHSGQKISRAAGVAVPI